LRIPTTINQHEGKKYLRTIHSAKHLELGPEASMEVDVYAVLVAFEVTCPAIAHAVKKLLCCGVRGKGDIMADLKGVQAAVARAIELEKEREIARHKELLRGEKAPNPVDGTTPKPPVEPIRG
jgi:hypothetical protein